jgi:hypothetical protein
VLTSVPEVLLPESLQGLKQRSRSGSDLRLGGSQPWRQNFPVLPLGPLQRLLLFLQLLLQPGDLLATQYRRRYTPSFLRHKSVMFTCDDAAQ